MITITAQEIIEQCPSTVLDRIEKLKRGPMSPDHDNLQSQSSSPNLSQLIHSTLTTSIPIASTQDHQPPPISTSVNINDVILDVENLPQFPPQQTTTSYDFDNEMDLTTTTENTNHPEVIEYLKSKKDHQLKFLKEVKMKGLLLKGGNRQGGVDQTQTNKFMNY